MSDITLVKEKVSLVKAATFMVREMISLANEKASSVREMILLVKAGILPVG